MDFFYRALRNKVSGDKKRYLNGVFDLDLTYITPRIIGVEAKYRNDINEVSDMLHSEHGANFRVYNLTERTYDYAKFGDRVAALGWPDHHAPPLILLFKIMLDMHQWLNADARNAGKGRTGTVITCYLLFCGLFDKFELAARYFAVKRSVNNWGVTGPSQQRYIEYMYNVLTQKRPPTPFPVRLQQIIFLETPGLPMSGKKGLMPVITLHDMNVPLSPRLIWESKPDRVLLADRDLKSVWQMETDIILWGDINMNIQHMGTWGLQQVARSAFNTGMVPDKMVLSFSKSELDDATNDKRFPADFKVIFLFEQVDPVRAAPRADITPQQENEFWARVFTTSRLEGRTCFWPTDDLQVAIQDARALADTRAGVVVERGGWLTKRGHKVRNWKRRWFVLHEDTLEYYENPKNSKPKGVIKLDDIQAVELLANSQKLVEMPNGFVIYTNWDDYICSAENESEADEWVNDLLLSLQVRESKKGGKAVDASVVGQMVVKVMEISHTRPLCYCVASYGAQKFKSEAAGNAAVSKDMVFDLVAGSAEPLLVQLWEVNVLFPDEIAGEIRITVDSLINSKAASSLEVNNWYAFRRKPSQVHLRITYKPRSVLDQQRAQSQAAAVSPADRGGRTGLTASAPANRTTSQGLLPPPLIPRPVAPAETLAVAVEEISDTTDDMTLQGQVASRRSKDINTRSSSLPAARHSNDGVPPTAIKVVPPMVTRTNPPVASPTLGGLFPGGDVSTRKNSAYRIVVTAQNSATSPPPN